jgi:putative ABC transport system substrate-binding protein
MQRREFIRLVGGTIAWPSIVQAQQAEPRGPIVGFLASGSRDQRPYLVPAIGKGLNDAGFTDPVVEYRFAEGHYDRLTGLAEELLRRNVSVIIADGMGATIAAKKATETIPIVFMIGADPVAVGLVRSFSRPGANLTGLVIFGVQLIEKRLEILRELLPKGARVALLVNPKAPNVALMIKGAEASAKAMEQELDVIEASADSELDAAFASLRQRQLAAVLVVTDPFLDNQRERLVALSFRYSVPAIYQWRDFTEAGGLVSYGPNLSGSYRQIAFYAGRILKGAKPSDLPVEQPTKFELVINLKTAKALGLNVPPSLLARADEVIE